MRSTSGELFNADGRLTQVEYANKAAMQGGTVIGVRSNSSAVLFTWADRPDDDDVFSYSPPRKIRKLTESIGIASSGIVSDVDYLANMMFEEANEYIYLFNSDPPASRLAQTVADFVHERTLSSRYRPMGVRICIASYDTVSNATITEIDVMGNVRQCELSCIGPYAERIVKKWNTTIDMTGLDASELVRECVIALRRCLNDKDDDNDVSSSSGDGDVAV